MTDPALLALGPLAHVIAETLHTTPVRLGRGGVDDLVAALTVRVGAYMGRQIPDTPGMAKHMTEVDAERQRQLAQWGEQHHRNGTGLPEDRMDAQHAREACEYAVAQGVVMWRDILRMKALTALATADPATLRAELIQCAASIQEWVHDLDGHVARCDVAFADGGQCAKPAGHRPPGSQDPHVPNLAGPREQAT
jgi:hypothetical protein